MTTSLQSCISALACGVVFPALLHATPPDVQIANTIVKVIAHTADGKSNLGSGVIIASNKVATNCHVTRAGQKIIVVKSGRHYPAIAQAALPELDACLLQTKKMQLPHAALAGGDSLKLGDDIYIYGYPLALGMRVMNGAIIGLHQYSDQKIIEINAGFMQGASGGGVFNHAGKLIGLTTFMGKKQGHYHFYAIPAAWLNPVLKAKFQPIKPFTNFSFWESGKFDHSTNR